MASSIGPAEEHDAGNGHYFVVERLVDGKPCYAICEQLLLTSPDDADATRRLKSLVDAQQLRAAAYPRGQGSDVLGMLRQAAAFQTGQSHRDSAATTVNVVINNQGSIDD